MVADAEAALRSGQIEATLEYGGGLRSTVKMRFDLGDAQRPSRLHAATVYQGATGPRATERIIIGDRSWERENGGQWGVLASPESVPEQIRAYLPNVGAARDAVTSLDAEGAAVRWYDASRDADLVLHADPATGVPRQLTQTGRGTGVTMTVVYSGWNLPVDITPPALDPPRQTLGVRKHGNAGIAIARLDGR